MLNQKESVVTPVLNQKESVVTPVLNPFVEPLCLDERPRPPVGGAAGVWTRNESETACRCRDELGTLLAMVMPSPARPSASLFHSTSVLRDEGYRVGAMTPDEGVNQPAHVQLARCPQRAERADISHGKQK